MKHLWYESLIVFVILLTRAEAQTNVLSSPPEHTVPSSLRGEWTVGKPYDTGQVLGLSDADERNLRAKTVLYASNYAQICGKRLVPEAIKSTRWTAKEFERNFDLSPKTIGLDGPKITEVFIEHSLSDQACGLKDFPGAHVFLDDRGRAVIEIEGDYFALVKKKPRSDRTNVGKADSVKH